MNRNVVTPKWAEDILGPDFHQTTLELGTDPDGEGDIFATVVRYCPGEAAELSGRPAILFVHGNSDYFFQRHVAEHYWTQGFAFYALDLRKCGRSHRDGQSWHHVTDLQMYDLEQNLALDLIRSEHNKVIVGAHSTGGLHVPLWLHRLAASHGSAKERHSAVAGLVLNSPWLGMSNVTGFNAFILRPLTALFRKLAPKMLLPAPPFTAYGESIHDSAHGEWSFDLTFKPMLGFPKQFSWMGAVLDAQALLQSGIDTQVPTLVLHSTESHIVGTYSPAVDSADAILDIRDMEKWGPTLSKNVTMVAIPGARHDVFLSKPHALAAAYAATDKFLDELDVK